MYDYYTAEDEELIEMSAEDPDGQEFLEALIYGGFDR